MPRMLEKNVYLAKIAAVEVGQTTPDGRVPGREGELTRMVAATTFAAAEQALTEIFEADETIESFGIIALQIVVPGAETVLASEDVLYG